MKAVITGMIGTYPLGGVVFDYGQYLVGLENLGFDVYYLEDSGLDSFDPGEGGYGPGSAYGVGFLGRSLASLSPRLAQQWHYRSSTGECFGLSAAEMARVVCEAEIFLNVSGSVPLREQYLPSRRKVLIDTDPGWNHFVNYPKWDEGRGWEGAASYRAHDHFFTYAANIGRPDCILPSLGLAWHPTVPPVIMDLWSSEGARETWTTVLTWKNFAQTIEYRGRSYGTKEIEFAKVQDLPQLVDSKFEMAIGGAPAPTADWLASGWSVTDSVSRSRTPAEYRDYIQASRGEFSVAKNVYVDTNSGWFSCRSVCYLAAGRPAVLQDTGFSRTVPTGEGLLAFTDLTSAVDAIDRVEADYSQHCEAARELARSRFDARVVLADILATVGL